jgi:hypothetical protein
VPDDGEPDNNPSRAAVERPCGRHLEQRVIPAEQIRNPEVQELAQRASAFLLSHAWCRSVASVHLAWAVAGVVGVFQLKLVPARKDIDDTLWVIVGDLPPAYLVCDESPSWREALESYVYEMRKWVSAVRKGESVEDIIPVNVAPTLAWADELDDRLTFISDRILNSKAGEIEGDA